MYSGSEIIFRNGENCQEVLCGRSLSLKVKKSRIKTFLGLFTTLRYVWPVTEAPTPLQRPHQSDKTQRQSRLHETVSYLINSSTLISNTPVTNDTQKNPFTLRSISGVLLS